MINTRRTDTITYSPVDENSFLINLDTRIITPPESFPRDNNNKPVVSVVGDQCSETIFFQCHHYFEDIDLINNMLVYIQWKNVASGKEGISQCKLSTNENPQLITFSWTISNQATYQAGDLIFSVRFMSYDEEQNIRYSLSTKNCVVAIGDNLNYEWPSPENRDNNYIEEYEMLDGLNFTTAFKVRIDGGEIT